MSPSAYDQWASIYDSVYSYVRDDIPFYVKQALDSGGDVLELGCGTGRVTIPIAEAGVDIVGLDLDHALGISGIESHKPQIRVRQLVTVVQRDGAFGDLERTLP